jgi:hypothetical protein
LPDTKSSIQQMLKAVETFIPRTNICYRWFYTCKTISVILFTSQDKIQQKNADIKNTLNSFSVWKHTHVSATVLYALLKNEIWAFDEKHIDLTFF